MSNRSVPYYLDVDDLKSIIRNCEALHGGGCNPKHLKHPHNLILIDVDGECITPVTQTSSTLIRYVALSYVWGHAHQQPLMLKLANFGDLSKFDSLGGKILPETIKNAMQLCRKLGEKYLWVDRLCIVQDDAATKHQHIQSMADIYGSAVFTIVAAAGNDATFGLPGISGHGRDPPYTAPNLGPGFTVDVGRSVWNERAWTYQEYLLSRRCIFLTSHQTYFQCREILWSEKSSMDFDTPQLLSSGTDPMYQYKRAVMEYNTRHITFPSDVLDAFSGIGSVLAQRMDTSLHHALPASRFQWALLWQHSGSFRWRKGSGHPSWTWLAWEGQIAFPHCQQFDETAEFYHNAAKLGLVKIRATKSQVTNTQDQQQHLLQFALQQQTIPECALVFTTTVAQVRLTRKDLYSSYLGVYARDQAKEVAGHLWLDQTAKEMELLNNELVYEVVLIASVAKGEADSARGLGKSQMHVILVRRNDGPSSKVSRIGVGWIYRYRWEQLPQGTQTVVLV